MTTTQLRGRELERNLDTLLKQQINELSITVPPALVLQLNEVKLNKTKYIATPKYFGFTRIHLTIQAISHFIRTT